MKIKTSLISALSMAVALATTAHADDDTSHPAYDSVVVFNENFNEHAANHDIEGLVALYDENAYWIAPDALPAQGRDGVPRQTITFMATNQGNLTHTIDDVFISDDGTQAVLVGVTAASVESKGVAFKGTYVYVLERDNEADPWQILVDMYNIHPAE